MRFDWIFSCTTGFSPRRDVGYRKIQFCSEQAKKDGLQYFWVDSCCIDKSSSAELSQDINSMFRWYKNAANCYVYLSDVSTRKRSRSSELLYVEIRGLRPLIGLVSPGTERHRAVH
jgi:hypothetical protein